MNAKAFTLIEMLLVITLIGLMIGATTWAFEGFVRSSSRDAAISQIIRADEMSRLASHRMGKPRSIQFDIPNQTLREVSTNTRTTKLSGLRLDKIVVLASDSSSTISYTPAGTSPSYAVRLLGKDESGWLVFSGLTGQTTWITHEHDAKNLLAIFSSRNDAR